MLDNPITSRVGCVRMFKVRVLPGQEQAYADYVRDVVEVIDVAAHRDDAFLDVVTVAPDDPESAEWTVARIFTFRDRAHRDALPERMAKAAAAYDGSDERRDARKAYAETLRKQIAVVDYSLCD